MESTYEITFSRIGTARVKAMNKAEAMKKAASLTAADINWSDCYDPTDAEELDPAGTMGIDTDNPRADVHLVTTPGGEVHTLIRSESSLLACAGCGASIGPGKFYGVCSDCGGMFCEDCMKNGTYDAHQCDDGEDGETD